MKLQISKKSDDHIDESIEKLIQSLTRGISTMKNLLENEDIPIIGKKRQRCQ